MEETKVQKGKGRPRQWDAAVVLLLIVLTILALKLAAGWRSTPEAIPPHVDTPLSR